MADTLLINHDGTFVVNNDGTFAIADQTTYNNCCCSDCCFCNCQVLKVTWTVSTVTVNLYGEPYTYPGDISKFSWITGYESLLTKTTPFYGGSGCAWICKTDGNYFKGLYIESDSTSETCAAILWPVFMPDAIGIDMIDNDGNHWTFGEGGDDLGATGCWPADLYSHSWHGGNRYRFTFDNGDGTFTTQVLQFDPHVVCADGEV